MADAPRRVSKWEHAFRAGRGDPVELVPHEEQAAMPDPAPLPGDQSPLIHVAPAADAELERPTAPTAVEAPPAASPASASAGPPPVAPKPADPAKKK